MKKFIPKKLKLLVAITMMLTLSVFALGGTSKAANEGQIEQGDFYYSKNLTTGSSFADPTAASKCETLQYKVRMHNPGATPVTNVRVKVNLPAGASTQNVSTATVTADNAFPVSVSDTAIVNLSTSQKIEYVSGTTKLLNSSNAVISSLPDGITSSGSGVNIGSVGVSVNEVRYVQFQAKVDCPTPPQPPQIAASCDLFRISASDNRKITVSQFKFSATNATFRSLVILWGDSSSTTVTDSNEVVGTTHQFNADGTYRIVATVHFSSADDNDFEKTSANCVQEVTFSPDKPPVITTPSAPGSGSGSGYGEATGSAGVSELVNSGAGSLAGIFTAAVISGVAGFRYYLGRRFSQQ